MARPHIAVLMGRGHTYRVLLAIAAGVLISSVSGVGPGVGKISIANAADTALAISPMVAADYDRFKKVGLPGYFAISTDGRVSGFSFCRGDDGCGDPAARLAVQFCEKEAKGAACKAYAKSGEILWKGQIHQPGKNDVALAANGWLAFPTEISWPGLAAKANGWSLLPPGDLQTGWLKFTMLDGKMSCFGSYSAASMAGGHWMLSCPGGKAASGTYRRKSGQWVSEGKDMSGQPVTMTTYFK